MEDVTVKLEKDWGVKGILKVERRKNVKQLKQRHIVALNNIENRVSINFIT